MVKLECFYALAVAASAAAALIYQIQALTTPTPPGHWFSSGVWSEKNPYGVEEGLVFSFPCRSKGEGSWGIVPELALNDWLRQKIEASQQELIEEREVVR